MPLTASPELRWLASACRQDDTALPEPPGGWKMVETLGPRHRVESLLHSGLARRGIRPPGEVAARLKAQAQTTAAANLLAAAESRRLLAAFTRSGLGLLFVKGLTLSQLAYGSATLKMSRDIDLLVRPGDVAAAARLLGELGYRATEPAARATPARWHRWSKESGWLGASGLLVELHSRLADSPALLPRLTAEGPGELVTIAPGIALPTLSADALPAYLAVHGASSAWFRLKWAADLHALLGRLNAAGLDDAASRMRELGAGRAGGQALLLLDALYDLPLSTRLRAALLADRRTRWLAGEALRQLEALREPTERRGGTAGIHLSQLLIGEQRSFPLAEGLRRAGEILYRRVSRG